MATAGQTKGSIQADTSKVNEVYYTPAIYTKFKPLSMLDTYLSVRHVNFRRHAGHRYIVGPRLPT